MIEEHYISCVLYFCYDCISSTSDHQALDPGGWGPRYKEQICGFQRGGEGVGKDWEFGISRCKVL